MTCKKCGKELPAGAAVCPACGVSAVPEAAPRPTVTVVPPYAPQPVQPAAPPKPVPAPPPKKRKPTGARVAVIVLTVIALVLELGLIFLWFWPTIQVEDSSVTLWSMHALCRGPAPYMSYILPALCLLAVLFTLAPLLRRFAAKRKRLLVPKLCTVLIAACYAVPCLVTSIADAIAALTGSGRIYHVNPFTEVCLTLFILLWVISELTIRNMRLVLEHQAEDLRAQLLAYDIQPRF